MTIQLLQTTRIGVAVNSVRKHCSDGEVVASAKILIKNWKQGPPEPQTLPQIHIYHWNILGWIFQGLVSAPGWSSVNQCVPFERLSIPQPRMLLPRRDSADSRSSTTSAISSSSSPQKRLSGER
uniref:TFIIS N-terminal domain-containing protein n=1 Tax=Strigops habroptila TaxID=2489341 RepID=A0A672U297_STRHB